MGKSGRNETFFLLSEKESIPGGGGTFLFWGRGAVLLVPSILEGNLLEKEITEEESSYR